MKKPKTKIAKSVQVGVSPKAHTAMKKKIIISKIGKNLREHINIINNLPAEA